MKSLALRNKAKGVGETESTSITTLGVFVCMSVGLSGGYSVCATRSCNDRGKAESDVELAMDAGDNERR